MIQRYDGSEYSALFAVKDNKRVTNIEDWDVRAEVSRGQFALSVANRLFPNKVIVHSFEWPKAGGYVDTLGRCGDDFQRRYFEVASNDEKLIEVFFGGEVGQDYAGSKMHLSLTKDGDVLCIFERGPMTQVNLNHFGFRIKYSVK